MEGLNSTAQAHPLWTLAAIIRAQSEQGRAHQHTSPPPYVKISTMRVLQPWGLGRWADIGETPSRLTTPKLDR